jgi:8-oxo-dGTP pyrophosphatase MutT (NUDIX family)
VSDAAEVFLFGPEVRGVHVSLVASTPPPEDDRVERVWGRLKQQNPKLFGGGVYSVLRFSMVRGEIKAAYDLYKRLVVQPEVETGVSQLSVSALAIGPDPEKRPCVLLGQRGEQTRIYGGMWQICPAGGVDPPENASDLRDLVHTDVEGALRREFDEEVGFAAPAGVLAPVAIVHDKVARSYDVVLAADFAHLPEPRPRNGSGWEHMAFEWVPIAQLPRFAREHPLIEPTAELFRALRWLPGQAAPRAGR